MEDKSTWLLLLLLISARTVDARSPLTYDAVMVLVVFELFVAFLIGISCIVFSLKMFLELNRNDETTRMYNSIPNTELQQHSSAMETASEYDVEEVRSIFRCRWW